MLRNARRIRLVPVDHQSGAPLTCATSCFADRYFGRTFGLPPGLPGGGITGVSPVSGVGARISGSTPDGGHNTPSDSASLSPRGLPERPTVEPSGEVAPRGAMAAQSRAGDGAAGAVCCGGVAGVGGACASAALDATPNTQPANIKGLHRMSRQREAGSIVPVAVRI